MRLVVNKKKNRIYIFLTIWTSWIEVKCQYLTIFDWRKTLMILCSFIRSISSIWSNWVWYQNKTTSDHRPCILYICGFPYKGILYLCICKLIFLCTYLSQLYVKVNWVVNLFSSMYPYRRFRFLRFFFSPLTVLFQGWF